MKNFPGFMIRLTEVKGIEFPAWTDRYSGENGDVCLVFKYDYPVIVTFED